MRTSGTVSLQGPDEFPIVPAGHQQSARLRLVLSKASKHAVDVPLKVAENAAGFPVRINPNTIRFEPGQTTAFVEVEVDVPRATPGGDTQVWVRAEYAGGGASIGLPVHVRRSQKRAISLGVLAAATGIGAAASWYLLKPKRRRRAASRLPWKK